MGRVCDLHFDRLMYRRRANRQGTGEVESDGNTAINSTDHSAIGANLQTAKAVQYIHDRWQKKLAHVLEDMRERVDRVRKAADNWQQTEKDIKKAFDN